MKLYPESLIHNSCHSLSFNKMTLRTTQQKHRKKNSYKAVFGDLETIAVFFIINNCHFITLKLLRR